MSEVNPGSGPQDNAEIFSRPQVQARIIDGEMHLSPAPGTPLSPEEQAKVVDHIQEQPSRREKIEVLQKLEGSKEGINCDGINAFYAKLGLQVDTSDVFVIDAAHRKQVDEMFGIGAGDDSVNETDSDGELMGSTTGGLHDSGENITYVIRDLGLEAVNGGPAYTEELSLPQ